MTLRSRAAALALAFVLTAGCSLDPSHWGHRRTTLTVQEVRTRQVGSEVQLHVRASGDDFKVQQTSRPLCRKVELGQWVVHEEGVTRHGPGYAILAVLSGAIGVAGFILWVRDIEKGAPWLIPAGLGALGAGLLAPMRGGGRTVYRTRPGGEGSRWESNSMFVCPPGVPTSPAPADTATVSARFGDGQSMYWGVAVPEGKVATVRRAAERTATVGAACGPAVVSVRTKVADKKGPVGVGDPATLLRHLPPKSTLTVAPGALSDLWSLPSGSVEETTSKRCEQAKEAQCLSQQSASGPACRQECLERRGAELCELEAEDCRLVAEGVLDCARVRDACLKRRSADPASLDQCQSACMRERAAITCRVRDGAGADPTWAEVPALPPPAKMPRLDTLLPPEPRSSD